MSLQVNVKGKNVILECYYGWSEPGRTPEITFDKNDMSSLPIQLLRISEFLTVTAKTNKVFTQIELQNKTGYSPSAWRQVRPIMKKLGFLTTDINENKKIDSDDPITLKGKAYNEVTKKRIANEKNYHELKDIQQMLWSKILLSYKTDNPIGLYPIRAIVRNLHRNEYLGKVEWDIMTTFITKNDDKGQEDIVDAFIIEYRDNPATFSHIKRFPSSKKGPKGDRQSIQNNRNTYWQNLIQGGLVKLEKRKINEKVTQVITLNEEMQSLIDDILSEEFFN